MKQTTTTTETIFVNLFASIVAEREQRLLKFIEGLNEYTDVSKILQSWYYSDLLPAGRKRDKWDIEALKSYLIERKKKATQKDIDKELSHLQAVEKAEDLESIKVSVEWKKNRTWGSNPTADARVCDTQYGYNFIGKASGCGYDKESAAIAQAINQSNSFLKAMYQIKEQNFSMSNRELFGYGSGNGILPRLEGGVGVSCYPKIFEKIGFKWSLVASGKTFDVYQAVK